MKPLVPIAISYILGICVSKYVDIPLFFVYPICFFLALAGLLFFFLKKSDFLTNLFLLLTVVSIGTLLTDLHTLPQDSNQLKNYHKETAILAGTIINDPERETDRIYLIVKAEMIKVADPWQETTGLVRVGVSTTRQSQPYVYGKRVILRGKLRSPPFCKNPGGFDYQEFLAQKKIFAVMWVKDTDIAELGDGDFNPIFRLAYQIKHWIKQLIYQTIPERPWPCASLLEGIMLGEKKALGKEVMQWFADTGTVHILAVSGFNVGIVGGIFFFLFYWLFRLPRKVSAILSLLAIIMFAIITGCQPSVVRASIMAGVFLFSILLDRDTDIYNNLALSALIILIINPLSLFEIGLQLSFVAVLGILYFTPFISPGLTFLPKWIATPLAVSIGAQLGISPFLVFYFNRFPLITVLANLIVVPLVGVITWLGFALFFAGLLSLTLAKFIAVLNFFLLSLLLKTVSLCAGIPFACLSFPTPSIIFICSYYFCIVALSKMERLGPARVIIGLGLLINIFLWAQVTQKDSNLLTVTFLDVGQGDSIFIEFPKGGNMLIDGGETEKGEYVLLPFLKRKGISVVDTLIPTHPDVDHIGGLIPVLENLNAGRIIENGQRQEITDKLLQIIKRRKIKHEIVRWGDEIRGYEGVKIYVLHPSNPLAKKDNNNSIVIKLVYNKVSFLFTGDIQWEAEEELLFLKERLSSTILKIPHHGSKSSWNLRFIKMVNPEIAVVEVGRNNRFNLPNENLLREYQKLGIKIYRTDTHGAVTVTTDGNGFWVNTMMK